MNDGYLVFAESDLEPGDTPFEDEIINNKKGNLILEHMLLDCTQ